MIHASSWVAGSGEWREGAEGNGVLSAVARALWGTQNEDLKRHSPEFLVDSNPALTELFGHDKREIAFALRFLPFRNGRIDDPAIETTENPTVRCETCGAYKCKFCKNDQQENSWECFMCRNVVSSACWTWNQEKPRQVPYLVFIVDCTLGMCYEHLPIALKGAIKQVVQDDDINLSLVVFDSSSVSVYEIGSKTATCSVWSFSSAAHLTAEKLQTWPKRGEFIVPMYIVGVDTFISILETAIQPRQPRSSTFVSSNNEGLKHSLEMVVTLLEMENVQSCRGRVVYISDSSCELTFKARAISAKFRDLNMNIFALVDKECCSRQLATLRDLIHDACGEISRLETWDGKDLETRLNGILGQNHRGSPALELRTSENLIVEQILGSVSDIRDLGFSYVLPLVGQGIMDDSSLCILLSAVPGFFANHSEAFVQMVIQPYRVVTIRLEITETNPGVNLDVLIRQVCAYATRPRGNMGKLVMETIDSVCCDETVEFVNKWLGPPDLVEKALNELRKSVIESARNENAKHELISRISRQDSKDKHNP